MKAVRKYRSVQREGVFVAELRVKGGLKTVSQEEMTCCVTSREFQMRSFARTVLLILMKADLSSNNVVNIRLHLFEILLVVTAVHLHTQSFCIVYCLAQVRWKCFINALLHYMTSHTHACMCAWGGILLM